MDTKLLSAKFEQIGARVLVTRFKVGRYGASEMDRIDIKSDRKGEYFDIRNKRKEVPGNGTRWTSIAVKPNL
jgi:hypothetical protein